jgi:hypothetical protein
MQKGYIGVVVDIALGCARHTAGTAAGESGDFLIITAELNFTTQKVKTQKNKSPLEPLSLIAASL